MKKVLIILSLLFFVAPQYINTFAMTQAQYYEQTILNEVKRNEKIQLSEDELKLAIKRTKNELLHLRSKVIAKDYKTSHKCYPSSIIKQYTIYTGNTTLNLYYDAYGNLIGRIEYYCKDSTLATANIDKYSPLAQAYESNSNSQVNTTQNVSSSKGKDDINGYIYYDSKGKVYQIGNKSVYYDSKGKVYQIGDKSVYYDSKDKVYQIGDKSVYYDSKGKVYQIGN